MNSMQSARREREAVTEAEAAPRITGEAVMAAEEAPISFRTFPRERSTTMRWCCSS